MEAIQAGYLPKDAIDSLDAARYLRDTEEYWPFEGDDWPDEFVGTDEREILLGDATYHRELLAQRIGI